MIWSLDTSLLRLMRYSRAASSSWPTSAVSVVGLSREGGADWFLDMVGK